MKHLCVCFLVVCLVETASGNPPAPPLRKGGIEGLKEARERWLRGNYEEARELYQELAKDAQHKDAAALGLSRTWQSEGEYDKAMASIEAALQASPKNADLHARRGELLYLRGRWDDAEKAADRAVDLKKEHFLARWVRAQVYRDRGELKKADAEFRWFVRTYSQRSDNDNDIKDPDELLLVGLAGCENARWNSLSDQFQFILTEVYGDALKTDKYFWPAEYQAGVLLLEKYNRADALPAFDKVLTLNPHAAEAYVGKGIAALQKYEIKEAEQFAERALKINPRLVEALELRADVHLASGALTKALEELERARAVNPRSETTLARRAACLLLQRQHDEFQKLVVEVEKHDPKAGLFYSVLAERLEDRRRFDEAEKFYRKAIELRPMVSSSQSGLGMLYMRLGREKEARTLLTRAFEADEFNVRVANSLKVLRHLDKYETLKTPHFELRYDPVQDRQLALYMARLLEEIYAELAEKFQYRPQGPFLVEVFNNHEMFSGRTIALPDLHTIGACTGRMVAMVSPRGKGIRKPFNWARVLRHELVHIFNLEQTHFLVPHWLTEGLAVSSEGYPRPQSWNQLLTDRVPKGELMNLDTIDLGFIRPRSPLDWHMAYCQSQLYVDYLTGRFGPTAIGGLLSAYAEGLDTDSAIQKVCKVDKAEFEKGYRSHLDDLVKTLRGGPSPPALTFRELREAHEKDPDNLDVAARLADYYFQRDKSQARKLAEQVLARKNGHPLASYVKAKLLRSAGEEEQALKLLQEALDPKAPEPKVLELLGKTYFDLGQFARAGEVFERARQAQPHDSRWLAELERVYAQTGDRAKRIAVLRDLVPTDPDDLDQRKLLARLLASAGQHAEAERYARQALEIDVLDADSQRLLGDALLAQKKFGPAVEVFQLVIALREKEKAADKEDEARLQLARAYHGNGQKKEALNEVTRVLARDDNNAEAIRLRSVLEKK